MEKMIDLKDLLKHEVLDLYSAEEQIIEAMPAMIDKAKDPSLKKALSEHLRITEKQKSRLDKVKQMLNEEAEEEGGEKKKGFLSGLFGGKQTCKGMEGLISEGEKVMGENMSEEVLDAAIIASAQKIEHYEICGYGTARAYARELNLGYVAELLEETLDEEYEADDKLTDLAVGRINEEAENAKGSNGRSGNGHPGTKRAGRDAGAKSTNGAKKSTSRGSNSSSAGKENSGRNSSSKAVRSSTGRSTSSTGSSRKSNGSSRSTSKGKTKAASSRGR